MKFELGNVDITRGCLEFLNSKDITPLPYYRRHASGDWGKLSEDDKPVNHQALIDGGGLVGSYEVVGEKIYVVTEWDRSVTTMLLADEY